MSQDSDSTTAASDFTRSMQLSGVVMNYGKDRDSEADDFMPADNECKMSGAMVVERQCRKEWELCAVDLN